MGGVLSYFWPSADPPPPDASDPPPIPVPDPTPTPAPQPPPAPPQRPVVDRSIFVQKEQNGQEIIRKGQLNGQPFCGDRLENCKVIINDFVDSVTIDRSSNSDFVLSAVRGSVFVRNCTKCRFAIVSGQFRCRDCQDCDFFLQVKTGPVIEQSTQLRIGCAVVGYPELVGHMEKAKLDPVLNLWDDIHDFTPGEGHFELVSGRSLEMGINEIGEEAVLVFTWGKAEGKRFAVTVPREELNGVARLSRAEGVKILKTEKVGEDQVLALVAARELAEVQAAFAGIRTIEIVQSANQ
jgi:protein XRP2